jgi:hypothetical protein
LQCNKNNIIETEANNEVESFEVAKMKNIRNSLAKFAAVLIAGLLVASNAVASSGACRIADNS